MVVVLVHGFQASTFDMLVIQRELLKVLPKAMFLNASCNENDTSGDIEVMGRRLADEVKTYLNRFFKDQKQVILNFVGHSMGGVISRAALPHLKNFSKQLGFYFSLSSPHLGYLNGVDLKIRAGLWFMRKTNKVLSLDQLTM
jgi:triacylglycerol esterase/lipase EstA (alpha/beta hydrolase family)